MNCKSVIVNCLQCNAIENVWKLAKAGVNRFPTASGREENFSFQGELLSADIGGHIDVKFSTFRISGITFFPYAVNRDIKLFVNSFDVFLRFANNTTSRAMDGVTFDDFSIPSLIKDFALLSKQRASPDPFASWTSTSILFGITR